MYDLINLYIFVILFYNFADNDRETVQRITPRGSSVGV